MAQVEDRGDKPIRCTPVVYDENMNCGVAVLYENGGGQMWGLVTPRNLIAAWRATEVLRLLSVIESNTLHASYYTALRNPHDSDIERSVIPMIEKIGRDAYDRIMSLPVPEAIIRLILDGQSQDFRPSLYPITEEVAAGTITWRQEFADAGVEHPDEIEKKAKEQEEIIAKYEALLTSYASHIGIPRRSLGMNCIENALVMVVKKGPEEGCVTNHVTVALAGVLGGVAVASLSALMMSSFLEDDIKGHYREEKEADLNAAASWLSKSSGTPLPFPGSLFGMRSGGLSFKKAKRLLCELSEKYIALI
ncbi:MAG: hypothetical protein RIT04_636 [Candidatus Parcubacteria bacterium]